MAFLSATIAILTSHEECRRVQRPVLRLESLHQGRKANDVDQHMQEARVYKGEGIQSVHWSGQKPVSTIVL